MARKRKAGRAYRYSRSFAGSLRDIFRGLYHGARGRDYDAGSTLQGIAAIGAVALVGVGGYLLYKYAKNYPNSPYLPWNWGTALYQSGQQAGYGIQNWLRSLQGLGPLVPVGQLTQQQQQAMAQNLAVSTNPQYIALIKQGYANAAGGTQASPYGGGFYLPQATGTQLSQQSLNNFRAQQAALIKAYQSGQLSAAEFQAQMTALNNQYVAISAMGG